MMIELLKITIHKRYKYVQPIYNTETTDQTEISEDYMETKLNDV